MSTTQLYAQIEANSLYQRKIRKKLLSGILISNENVVRNGGLKPNPPIWPATKQLPSTDTQISTTKALSPSTTTKETEDPVKINVLMPSCVAPPPPPLREQWRGAYGLQLKGLIKRYFQV
jgi:hypothetical protein